MVYDLQKGSMWKRISAFLFDFIIMTVITVLFALILSWATGYDGWQQSFSDAYRRVEDEYGVRLDLNYEEYKALTEEQNDRLTAAYDALREDGAAMKAYQMIRTLSQLIVSISILLGVLIWEFVIPLKLKDGRTLGKKIFGLALMRTDGVRVSAVSMFIRTVLGKFAIEAMVPAIILMMIFWGVIDVVGPAVLLGIVGVAVGFLTGADTARIYQTAENNNLVNLLMRYSEWIVQVYQTYKAAFLGA